jgi:hypothetical protein
MSEKPKRNLPKWAESEIADLQGKVVELETVIAQMSVTSESNIAWSLPMMLAHHLPTRATVRFALEGEFFVDVSLRYGGLYVNGSRGMVIYPNVSNAILIKGEE